MRNPALPCLVGLWTLICGGSGAAATSAITGVLVDVVCYTMDKSHTGVDHDIPDGHEQDCAIKCVRTGLPVAVRTADGSIYLVVGPLTANGNSALLASIGNEV